MMALLVLTVMLLYIGLAGGCCKICDTANVPAQDTIKELTAGFGMAKYGPKAQEKVRESMEELKKGELKSGKSGKKVTNPKQAVAIGLSKARKEGAKVPRKNSK